MKRQSKDINILDKDMLKISEGASREILAQLKDKERAMERQTRKRSASLLQLVGAAATLIFVFGGGYMLGSVQDSRQSSANFTNINSGATLDSEKKEQLDEEDELKGEDSEQSLEENKEIDNIHQSSGTVDNLVEPIEKLASPTVAVPTTCQGYVHDVSTALTTDYNELLSGVVGKWQGCAFTPWTDKYLIEIEFKADGTYKAKKLDTEIALKASSALYYGIDDGDNSKKTYNINTVLDNGKGYGDIAIVFGGDSTNTNDLRNISLRGNTLEFDFLHRNSYGPLEFKLVRVNQ